MIKWYKCKFSTEDYKKIGIMCNVFQWVCVVSEVFGSIWRVLERIKKQEKC